MHTDPIAPVHEAARHLAQRVHLDMALAISTTDPISPADFGVMLTGVLDHVTRVDAALKAWHDSPRRTSALPGALDATDRAYMMVDEYARALLAITDAGDTRRTLYGDAHLEPLLLPLQGLVDAFRATLPPEEDVVPLPPAAA